LTEEGIWLLYSSIDGIQPIKVDNDNKILKKGPLLPFFNNDDELRHLPLFLYSDSLSNVYFFNIKHSKEIVLYKINSNEDVIWNKNINIPNINFTISQAKCIDKELICVGMAYDVSNEIYDNFAFSISIDDGSIVWKKRYENDDYFSGFFDIVLDNKNNPIILETGIDEKRFTFHP